MKTPETQSHSRSLCRICYLIVAVLSIVTLWLVRPGKVQESFLPIHGDIVLVDGSVRHSGIYPIGANSMADSVIKMAAGDGGFSAAEWRRLSALPLAHGDRLTVVERPCGALVVKGVMSVAERLLMNVPLDINSMSTEDFEQLPGVGATMAQRIVEYRHKNGGTMVVDELKQVQGIGDKKFQALGKYFK